MSEIEKEPFAWTVKNYTAPSMTSSVSSSIGWPEIDWAEVNASHAIHEREILCQTMAKKVAIGELYFSKRSTLAFVIPELITENAIPRVNYYDISYDRRQSCTADHFMSQFTQFNPKSKDHAEKMDSWMMKSHPGTVNRLIARCGAVDKYSVSVYQSLAVSQSAAMNLFD